MNIHYEIFKRSLLSIIQTHKKYIKTSIENRQVLNRKKRMYITRELCNTLMIKLIASYGVRSILILKDIKNKKFNAQKKIIEDTSIDQLFFVNNCN